MLLNLNETPELGDITIDGRLTFKTDIGDITLKATTIWVKTGQFYIGTSDEPFPNKASIVLDGERESDTVPITSIETGNKILANTGEVKWYGQDVTRMTRLEQVAEEGSQEVFVGTQLGWEAGQKVYFAPTTLQHDQSDIMTIEEYNGETGYLKLTEPLPNYHYGA